MIGEHIVRACKLGTFPRPLHRHIRHRRRDKRGPSVQGNYIGSYFRFLPVASAQREAAMTDYDGAERYSTWASPLDYDERPHPLWHMTPEAAHDPVAGM
jgi:hypothetical protein